MSTSARWYRSAPTMMTAPERRKQELAQPSHLSSGFEPRVQTTTQAGLPVAHRKRNEFNYGTTPERFG